jgi:hypothetical protein
MEDEKCCLTNSHLYLSLFIGKGLIKMNIHKSSSVEERLIEFFVVIILLSVLFVFVYRRYILNCNNGPEIARRILCLGNLRKIASLLKERNLQLKTEDIPAIQNTLDELNLTCLSGEKIHSIKTDANYRVLVLSTNGIVIAEDIDNHNTKKMKFTNKPYIRFCLFAPAGEPNDISLGYWPTNEPTFDNIKLFQGDLETGDSGFADKK